MMYRSAPCNGVKICPQEGCNFVGSISRQRSCDQHPDLALVKSNTLSTCAVEFCYLYPKNTEDNRRWISGFLKHPKGPLANLHNHLTPPATRIGSMVKEAIQKCAEQNPQIVPFQVSQGKGLGFIPGVVDAASTHLGRLANTLRKGKEKAYQGHWNISSFESRIADEIDKTEAALSDNKAIHDLSRPYLCSAGSEGGIEYIHTMNPLQTNILSQSEFVQADITYNEAREYIYLFNLVAFDYITMEWAVVSRVRMNKEGAKAYGLAFKKSFQKCQEDYPSFEPGKSLLGVVTDWSDAEIAGLGQAVGKETAQTVLSGCKVHWCRSWQRVRDRVCGSNNKPREKTIFAAIASQIKDPKGSGNVTNCFRALCGQISLREMLGIIKGLTLEDAVFVEKKCNWKAANNWANWWLRPAHMNMLHKDFSFMPQDVWDKCPDNTNAVERKNRDSKQSTALPIQQAFVNLYKLDKAYCAKHLAAKNGSSLQYYNQSAMAKVRQAEVRSKQRNAKRKCSDIEAIYGPPDKDSHFEPNRRVQKKRHAQSFPKPSKKQSLSESEHCATTDYPPQDFIVSETMDSEQYIVESPDMSIIGRNVKMRFFVEESKSHQFFNGKITDYNSATGEYGVYFPIDQETVYVPLGDPDLTFVTP